MKSEIQLLVENNSLNCPSDNCDFKMITTLTLHYSNKNLILDFRTFS